MDGDQNVQDINSSEQFGMTEQDYKNTKINGIFNSIKIFFLQIEPTVVKLLNVAIYYLIKFIKAFVKTSFEMIKGGGS